MTLPYSLVASDFDHTLAEYPVSSMSARTASSIRRVRGLGACFVVVSGRSSQSLLALLRRQDLDFPGLLTIASNGAEAVQAWDRKPLVSHRLGADLTVELLSLIDQFLLVSRVAEGRYVYARHAGPDAAEFERKVNDAELVAVPSWAEARLSPHKIQINGSRADLEDMVAAVTGTYGDQATVVFSATELVEITAQGIDKGRALRDLCGTLGIDPALTIAFGDNQNDLSLLGAAGMGVAVGNAIDEVQRAADRVTASCADDGVALALEEIFGL